MTYNHKFGRVIMLLETLNKNNILIKGWAKLIWSFGNAGLGGGDPVTFLSSAITLYNFVTVRNK